MPRTIGALSITAQSEVFGGVGEETRLYCTNIAARGSQGNLCLAAILSHPLVNTPTLHTTSDKPWPRK